MRKSDQAAELTVDVGPDATTTALVYRAAAPAVGAALLLAHGAGAGQRSPFIVDVARAISGRGVDVATFDFLYMQRRKRVPDRAPLLEACYIAAIRCVRDAVATSRHALFIGGKSMGGRIATQVAAADAALPVAGLVLLGYPLHPPGRPDRLRDAHLPAVKRPALFVQGSRDAFGTPDELGPILAGMSPRPTLHVVENGDHSFKVTGRKGTDRAAVHEEIQRTIVEWVTATMGANPGAGVS